MAVNGEAIVRNAETSSSERYVRWAWSAAVLCAALLVWWRFGQFMDGFEVGALFGSALGIAYLGWEWRPFRILTLSVGAGASLAVALYAQGAQAESNFFLKFLISSQSAIMWMSALYVGATATYFAFLLSRNDFVGAVASSLAWTGSAFGLIGMGVRWRESYLINPDWGHIPISNLYEVFILFAIITTLVYLYYEGRFHVRSLGAFAMLVVSASVAFLLWYTFDRQAHEIQPLVPALQSYWMKIHVPANFVGYGAFSLAAMAGVARLLAGDGSGFVGRRLPPLAVMDDVMYKAVAIGFAFFTIATVLGAMWAAEAWGGYWSWDPKEVWALIVWLNYAGWLHARITRGVSETMLAWWAIIGLFVVTFAFIGVNMFLSGLHSYGEL